MPADARAYRIGAFTLDCRAYRLLRDGMPVDVSPKSIDLLLYLVERPSTLIDKDALFAALWPNIAVTDNALVQAISDLRRALGDNASQPHYIQTVPRRGYRFVGSVEIVHEPDAAPADVARPPEMPQADTTPPPMSRVVRASARGRETASLAAARALADGRLRLETLDPSAVASAMEDFERAIRLDPGFAAAYVGLASAHVWKYELRRATSRPDRLTLERAIELGRRACALDDGLAEAHATLALALTFDGQTEAAIAEARRAVDLDPGAWPHHFRLGHASWGEARLRALATAAELYSSFSYVSFDVAMVLIARGALDEADRVLTEGVDVQDRQIAHAQRFPARGLYWLRGLVRLARGDVDAARADFDRERAQPRDQLHAAEFVRNTDAAIGCLLLRQPDADGAAEAFERALAAFPDHARSRLGLSLARERQGRPDAAAREMTGVRAGVEDLRASGNQIEASLVEALIDVARGRPDAAIDTLSHLLAAAPPGTAGWTIPIEPLLAPLHGHDDFTRVLQTLRERAR